MINRRQFGLGTIAAGGLLTLPTVSAVKEEREIFRYIICHGCVFNDAVMEDVHYKLNIPMPFIPYKQPFFDLLNCCNTILFYSQYYAYPKIKHLVYHSNPYNNVESYIGLINERDKWWGQPEKEDTRLQYGALYGANTAFEMFIGGTQFYIKRKEYAVIA